MEDEVQPCPCCGQRHYRFGAGETDSDGQQISPDAGGCDLCGFQYVERQGTVQEQVAAHLKDGFADRFMAMAAVAAAEHDRVAKTCKQVMWVADALKGLHHTDLCEKLEQAMLPFLWTYDYDRAERIADEHREPEPELPL